jgi:two-component system, OmpR family, sensor histidine kinase KdpD
MQQVFTNLLTNSLKYSPPGSTIRIIAKPKDRQFLLVRVSNQSMPVPETDLERIFDKFYRINPSERVTGSGLGLSICKGIIEAHGGTIWAENLTDGLAFNFTLPIISHT